MVGENFEIYSSQMAENALKLSTMVGENFEIYLSQIAKNALKLSTMVSIFMRIIEFIKGGKGGVVNNLDSVVLSVFKSGEEIGFPGNVQLLSLFLKVGKK